MPHPLAAAAAIADSLAPALLAKLATDPPPTLYHYTSPEGLVGVFETRQFWATHYQYLNDPLEGALLLEGVNAEAERRRSLGTEDARWFNTSKTYREFSVWYSVSLTALGDDLPQWRSYGADGYGFSLGVDTEGLRKLRVSGAAAMLVRVRYGHDEREEFAAALLDGVTSALRRLRDTDGLRSPTGDVDGDLGRIALFAVGMLAQRFEPAFKAHSYVAEAEWRLVFRGPDLSAGPGPVASLPDDVLPVVVRPIGRQLVPFVKVPVAIENVIRSITIGPCVNESLTRGALARLLLNCGADPSAAICLSKHHYRGR